MTVVDKRWYVIYVKFRREAQAKQALESMGIETIVPIENRLIRRGKKWIRQPYVLFPDYVFIHIRFDWNLFARIMNISHVIRMLGRYMETDDEDDEDDFSDAIKKSKPKKTKLQTFEPVPLTQYEEKLLIKERKLFEEPPTIRLNDDGSCEVLTKGFKRIKILKIDRHARRVTFLITIAGNKMEFTMSFIKADDDSATKAE